MNDINHAIETVTTDLLEKTMVGSEGYAATGHVLTELYTAKSKIVESDVKKDLKEIELKKLELEKERLELEREIAETDKKKPWFEVGKEIAKTGLTVVGTLIISRKIMKFEETGCLTSKSWGWLPKFLR